MIAADLLRRLRNDLPMPVTIAALGREGPPSKMSEGYFRFVCPRCGEMRATVNPRNNLAHCRQLHQEQAEHLQRTGGFLLGGGPTAVKALLDMIHDVAAAASDRRRSAKDVLELILKYREASSLEQRVLAIEEHLAASPARLNGPGDPAKPAAEAAGPDLDRPGKEEDPCAPAA